MTTQIYELWVAVIVLAVAGLILAVVLALPDLRRLALALRSRGEVADGPDFYDVDIVPGMRDSRDGLRDALVDVRADRIEVNRQLALIAEAMPDLATLPQQLEGLYVIEVER